MNGVDKDHRPELWSDIPSSVDHLGYCKKKYLYVLFSGTVMLVLASLAVPSLTLVCVCACSCVGLCISYVGVIKIWGWGYGGHGSATVLSFQKVCVFCCVMKPLEHHLSYLSKEKLCKSGFSRFSRCSTIMSTEFAVFLLCTKRFNVLTIYCGKAYSICDK